MLNNDTLVTDGWLNALMEPVAKDDNLAVVGAKLLYPNDLVQHAGVVFNQKGKVYHLYRYFHRDHPAVNKTREFQVVTSACLLIRTQVFMQVGLFDENFRNGFEDVDLCLRARQSGYRLLYNPDCVVYHLESMTPAGATMIWKIPGISGRSGKAAPSSRTTSTTTTRTASAWNGRRTPRASGRR